MLKYNTLKYSCMVPLAGPAADFWFSTCPLFLINICEPVCEKGFPIAVIRCHIT